MTEFAWTLETGVTFCRQLEALLLPMGYHCALGGSTLHTGWSAKDLDVFIYPHTKGQGVEVGEVEVALAKHIGGRHQTLYRLKDTPSCPRDDKAVYAGEMPDGKRIDFFFLT